MTPIIDLLVAVLLIVLVIAVLALAQPKPVCKFCKHCVGRTIKKCSVTTNKIIDFVTGEKETIESDCAEKNKDGKCKDYQGDSITTHYQMKG